MEPTGRLGILPLDGAVADARLVGLSDEQRYGSMQMALPDGSVLSRGWAVAGVTAWLPGLQWVGWTVAKVPGAGSVLDALYGVVADRRGRLAGLVPDVEPVERPGEP